MTYSLGLVDSHFIIFFLKFLITFVILLLYNYTIAINLQTLFFAKFFKLNLE